MTNFQKKILQWMLLTIIAVMVLSTVYSAFIFREQSHQQTQAFQENITFFASKYERDINITIIAFDAYLLDPFNKNTWLKYNEKNDILWSRINALDKGSQGLKFNAIKNSAEILKTARLNIKNIDAWNIEIKSSAKPKQTLVEKIRRALDQMATDGRLLIRNAQDFQNAQNLTRQQHFFDSYLRILFFSMGILFAGGLMVIIYYRQNIYLSHLGSDLEVALKDRNHQLTRTEAIVGALPDVLFILDEDGNFIEEITDNPELLLAEREDYIDSNLCEILGHDNATIVMDGIKKSLIEGKLSFAELEIYDLKHSGFFELRIAPFPLMHKNKRQVLIIRRDITAQKDLENRLRRAQQMEAVGQLTGGLAHDFNNLLTIMLGNAERIQRRMTKTNSHTKNISSIIDAGKRAASLTHRLLAFSRKQPLLPHSVQISKLIAGLEELLKHTLGETIHIVVHSVPDLWPAIIDTSQFENALINLAANARDAMPNGGTLRIETTNITIKEALPTPHGHVTPGDYVLVSICDSGQGMTTDVLDKVFEPFYTTKDVGKGSGLGLSMVYGFARQSKGHILIDSEIGIGTTIRLFVPRSNSQPETVVDPSPLPRLSGGTEHILVVEDEDSVRDIISIILSDHGYKVTEAANGQQAIEILKAPQIFKLLFTDVVLPGGMNGFEIAEQAKHIQPEIKILFTTGYAETDIIENSRLEIGNNLIKKPYRQTDVLDKIREVLDQ